PHEQRALAKAIEEVLRAGAELVIVFGASAIADRRDVIPAAVEAIGGKIEHFGMPVDPGNLLLLADARGRPVLGAPGCAGSPKENGFDWVLMRLLAGLAVPREAITGLGVGGLLMEIVTRPQPRDEPVVAGKHRIAAVVLAAGRSTRMGGPNKLLAEIGGKPLVRIAAEQALASRADPVIVVTGHQRERVEPALAGLPVRLVSNPDFAQGRATSSSVTARPWSRCRSPARQRSSTSTPPRRWWASKPRSRAGEPCIFSRFTNLKRLPTSLPPFLRGGGASMTSFGQILARVVVAGSLVATGAVAVEAAGALAVGSCGAYGFAYDYRQPEIAR